MDDLNGFSETTTRKDEAKLLIDILERRHYALNHDGRQWYTQLHEACKTNGGPWLSLTEVPPTLSLIPCPRASLLDGDHGDINLVIRLPSNPDYVVTVSTAQQEICVWSIVS